MPLPLTVSCFSKIHIGFTFLVPAHLGSPRQRAVKRVCVCVRACVRACMHACVCDCHTESHAVFTVEGVNGRETNGIMVCDRCLAYSDIVSALCCLELVVCC